MQKIATKYNISLCEVQKLVPILGNRGKYTLLLKFAGISMVEWKWKRFIEY